MPSPVRNDSPPHPFLQHFSREFGSSQAALLLRGVTAQSAADTAPEKRKPSCGRLTRVSIQSHFLNQDQETHGLTPLILSPQGRAQGAKIVQFYTHAKLCGPKPTGLPQLFLPLSRAVLGADFHPHRPLQP